MQKQTQLKLLDANYTMLEIFKRNNRILPNVVPTLLNVLLKY